MSKTSINIRRITVSAIFLSLSLVLKTVFTIDLSMFGQNGMRIGISGIFSIMPSMLFGPVYGAAVSGLSDLMGFLLNPTGPYMPVMTLIVAAGGYLRGALWMLLRGKSGKNMRISVAVLIVLLLAFGICNAAFLKSDGVDADFYSNADINAIDTSEMHSISRMLIERTIGSKDPGGNLKTYIVSLTSGLIGSAVFGVILLTADIVISKRIYKDPDKSKITQIFLAMTISGLLVTTFNTVALRETIYQSWKALPFSVVWIPRLAEEILGNIVKAYFVATLYAFLENRSGFKEILK